MIQYLVSISEGGFTLGATPVFLWVPDQMGPTPEIHQVPHLGLILIFTHIMATK